MKPAKRVTKKAAATGMVRRVVSLPTAPFHEHRVIAFLEKFAKERGLPFAEDRYGNVFVRYKKGRAARPIAFEAHMDHPGFEIVASGRKQALACWFGGIPQCGLAGRRILVHGETRDKSLRGRIEGPVERSRLSGRKPFPISLNGKALPGWFGHPDLVPFRLQGDLAYTKSADDLGGVATICLLLDALATRKPDADVRAVFTRAEEVGFHGAMGILSGKMLPATVPIVVIETSRAVEGARIGHGPVIRLGDKASCFDPALLGLLRLTASQRKAAIPAFRYQTSLMPGGTCEATLYQLGGRRACGISIPLGNYHNSTNRGVAPEYVSLDDLRGVVDLLWDLSIQKASPKRVAANLKKAIEKDKDQKLANLRATTRNAPRRSA